MLVLTAIVLDLVFAAVAFGVRTVVQVRRTGDPGWRLGRPHSGAEAGARLLLFAAAALLAIAAWLAARADAGWHPVAAVGVVLAVASVAFVAVAQLQMGSSWRI